MAFPIVGLIQGLFKPAADLIDKLHTSEEERMQMKAKMMELEVTSALHFLDYEKQLMDSQAKIVLAEVQGGSWLQRSWRPITMLVFLLLAVCDAMGIIKWASGQNLAPEAWTLLQIGLGGYVIGRSAEKGIAGWKRNGHRADSQRPNSPAGA